MRVSVGDASLTNILARQGADLRGQVQRAAQEVATGRHTDIGKHLRGDFSPLLAIDASLARLAAFKSTAADAAFQVAAQQASIQGLSQLASGISTALLGARDVATPAQIDTLAADARGRLASAVGLLNVQASGRAVFSGQATGTPPLGPVEDMLAALETAAAGATTAGQVAAAVTTWFNDPLGFASFYRGEVALTDVPVAPGETAEISTTAMDPAIRDTLAGLAMAALLDRGVLAADRGERARLAVTAGQELMRSEDARIALAARIGAVEAQIESARTRNGAEETALGILRSETGSVDPYEAATRLETFRAQLESLYLVTARVSRLSLTEYLR
ncbi:flagellin [Rhodobacter calidifons]|uniref:Flagellar biosynthesis protein FlgL n=1 Tax=Rhodobacter calidifons TaxID=2715277 RepID=A0ABX0G4M3_9RHOB|nr:flagellin [Rhodobacter calidifons]NHB75922.1 flagellar biosynthesis protein FlgL [Rhodobacter calidifons]